MQCEKCRRQPASVHVTRIINGKKSEIHLCNECAAEGQEELGFSLEPPFSIQNLLAELLNYDDWFAGRGGPAMKDTLTCGGCGLTYKEFTRAGLLGCPRCYEDFAPHLEPLLQRVHGNLGHNGKIPRSQEGAVNLRREVARLRRELEEAVAGEEFERAARLRDEIRELNQKMRVHAGSQE